MVGNEKVRATLFADEVIVSRHKEEKVLERLNAWEEVVREYGMKFNINLSM